MKTTILLILGLIISISSFSKKHNDLTLVPRGSFNIQELDVNRTVSIETFWMSNEITNREFRQFYNQIKNNPNELFSWLDLSSLKKDETSKPKIIEVKYSEIIDKLIDDTAWKAVLESEDYFINSKYDDYPVIGVTWEGARYYCIWRTKEENKKLEDKALQMDYRLPTQYEWEYALTFSDSKTIVDSKELRQANKGDKNKLGLLNLNSNVSEWTSSSDLKDNDECKVVKGKSWKSDAKDSQRELVSPDRGTDYIGFRIVRSDIKRQ